MRDNTEVGGLNLVIYDADHPSDSPTEKQDTGNHGIIACRKKLEAIKNDFGVDFDYHIWPDNQSNGELEDLLIQLIPSPFDPLLECIKSYSDCLKQSGISNIETPSLKEKINTYCYATAHAKTARKRDYKDENFWNLNISENLGLATFKNFLDKFLTPPPLHPQK
jgi:hypothetical protein